jgi:hypothetical protein
VVAQPKSPYAYGARFVDGGFFNPALPSAFVTVGIDQSLTGFAVTALHPNGEYATWCYTSKLRDDERLRDIEDFVGLVLDEVLNMGPIGELAMEGYANAAKFGREIAGELGYAVRSAIWDWGKEKPLVIPPTSLKKYATSNGNAKKNEILLGVYKRWGVEFTDDNMADSYVLAHIAAGNATFAYQTEVLTKLGIVKEKS